MSAREFFWKHDVGVKLILSAIALLLIANLTYLNRTVLYGAREATDGLAERLFAPAPAPATDVCDEACQRIIDQKVSEAIATLSASPRTIVEKSPQPSFATTYISLGNGGSTKSTDWVRAEGSEVVFNLAGYPSGSQVYWEGNLKAGVANSRCFARLFDKTNLRTVDFSEQSTDETSFEYLRSQPLVIWSGNNKYQLEIRSLNGIECTVESAKILIKS